MTVRVRFAPSPTGYLHIGGARTALFCYAFAQSLGGKTILRIEDTDISRSEAQFEEQMIKDLQWLGLEFDEGPHVGGDYGPYRQSERLHFYQQKALMLLEAGKAFYCFCKEEDLNTRRDLAKQEGSSQHYDGHCRKYTLKEAREKLEREGSAAIRFKMPERSFFFHDEIRGDVTFPTGMIGDFVIIRSDGMPVYNYCCVVDDWMMNMTHVIRAEEHLPNTLRQLALYEAFEASPPVFAHVSLLIGKDRQKLSKRHGAVSVSKYREDHYLPEALVNYLFLLGWSHPQEKDIFSLKEVCDVFDLRRMTKSPAIFDEEKCQWVNGQYLRALTPLELVERAKQVFSSQHIFFRQTEDWQRKCLELFKNHIQMFHELHPLVEELFVEHLSLEKDVCDMISSDGGQIIYAYLSEDVNKRYGQEQRYFSDEQWDVWSEYLKREKQLKGKVLFMGLRSVVTGRLHGPELKYLLPLIPVAVLQKRLSFIKETIVDKK
jgi:glutamyl-tRNA synthetase